MVNKDEELNNFSEKLWLNIDLIILEYSSSQGLILHKMKMENENINTPWYFEGLELTAPQRSWKENPYKKQVLSLHFNFLIIINFQTTSNKQSMLIQKCCVNVNYPSERTKHGTLVSSKFNTSFSINKHSIKIYIYRRRTKYPTFDFTLIAGKRVFRSKFQPIMENIFCRLFIIWIQWWSSKL